MPAQHCRLAVVQHPPVFLNLARSVDRAAALIQDALAQGAQCIVFPETWLPGYPVWLDEAPTAGLWDYPPAQALYQVLADNAISIPGPEVERLRTLAMEGRTALVMGAHERAGGTLYNTMLLIAPDGSCRVHRKVMPTYTERLVWGMGDGSTLAALETPFGRITRGHLALDVDGHYARPDIFQLLVNDRPQANVRFASDAGPASA